MRIGILAMIFVGIAGCGGPMLQNVRYPSGAYVGGAAAIVSAVLTLADPSFSSPVPEVGELDPLSDARVDHSALARTTVPEDVFDRLDQARGMDVP